MSKKYDITLRSIILSSENRFNVASIKPEFGTSGFFTTTPLMGIRTLLNPGTSSKALKAYCEDDCGEEKTPDPTNHLAKEIRGMEISGSNGRFSKEESTRSGNIC